MKGEKLWNTVVGCLSWWDCSLHPLIAEEPKISYLLKEDPEKKSNTLALKCSLLEKFLNFTEPQYLFLSKRNSFPAPSFTHVWQYIEQCSILLSFLICKITFRDNIFKGYTSCLAHLFIQQRISSSWCRYNRETEQKNPRPQLSLYLSMRRTNNKLNTWVKYVVSHMTAVPASWAHDLWKYTRPWDQKDLCSV